MIPRTLSLALLSAVALVVGCKDDGCAMKHAITPGCGILVEDLTLRLGDGLDELTALYGQPETTDLGAAGLRHDFEALGTTVFCSTEPQVVTSLMITEGFEGRTADDLGLASSEADITAALGPGTTAPYLSASWYGSLGIGFELDSGQAARVHVFYADDGW